jgi:hypothetical protein
MHQEYKFIFKIQNLWAVEGKIAGYVKEMKYLTFLGVHGAGHFVPLDQPKNSLDMMNKFIKNESYCTPSSPLVHFTDENGVDKTTNCDVSEELCSLTCRNGKCINGDCQCNDGFAGNECSSKLIQIDDFLDLNSHNIILQQQETIYFEIKKSNDNFPMSLNLTETFKQENNIFPWGSKNNVIFQMHF